jgi:maltokinase
VTAAADLVRGDLSALPEDALGAWLPRQRWFASKSRALAGVHVVEAVPLPAGEDGAAIVVTCVEARFATGAHEVYQLVLALDPAGEDAAAIAQVDGVTVLDAFADRGAAAAIARLFRDEARAESRTAEVAFRWGQRVQRPSGGRDVRPMGAEQSNTSLVFDSALVLKAFRRLERGDNPELEMLRFLTARGFPNIPALGGWYELRSDAVDATLGVVQRFVEGGRDGWELTLDELASAPEGVPARLRELGAVVGAMHAALGSDPADPEFAPEELGREDLSPLMGAIDEQVERAFAELSPGAEGAAPIAGRGEEVRERLRALSDLSAGGRAVRHHGDLHLGQTLLADAGWIVLDFEGEPARPLPERRRKQSPLRDVAGMLRSIAYAASAAEKQRGVTVPEGWEERSRAAFLEGYLAAVEPSLLPPGEAATAQLLSIFELEKAVYELRYELNNRPDWVGIPVAGIVRLLEEPLR